MLTPPTTSSTAPDCTTLLLGDAVNGSDVTDTSSSLNCVADDSTTTSSIDYDAIYSDPSYYSSNYRIIGALFQGAIFIVGVLGNALVVLVVKRKSSLQSPTNCYLVSLALADCVVLFTAVPAEIVNHFVLVDEWLWGRTGCALFVFLQYLGINASSLSITAFTVERYIAICHPMRAQTVCTVRRAKRIILAVWSFATIYCSPWLLLTTTTPLFYKGFTGKEQCTFALERNYYLGYFFTDLVVFYVFPLLLSCVLYAMIARILVTASTATANSAFVSKQNSSNCQNNQQLQGNLRKRPSSPATAARIQVVRMLVVVVVLFAVLWMPYRVFLVYNSLADPKYMELWFLMFSKTLIYMNSAINPILYNAMSQKFRKAFRRMLSCNGGSESSSGYSDIERGATTFRYRSTGTVRRANTEPQLPQVLDPA